MQEFLRNYYLGHSETDQDDIRQFLNADKRVVGRCGYLRQAFPFIFRDYKYNKFNFHIDGINHALSDIDHVSNLNKLFSDSSFDIQDPPYFRKNPVLRWIQGHMTSQKGEFAKYRKIFFDGLLSILQNLEFSKVDSIDNNQGLMTMLESLKNSFTGKVHLPHSFFIDKGVHAITVEAVWQKSKEKYEGDYAQTVKAIGKIEAMMMSYDRLDEQLHAGYYTYFLTSMDKFVSNSMSLYPIIMVLLSYIFGLGVDYGNFLDDEDAEDKSMTTELKFLFITYSLCALFVNLPSILMLQSEGTMDFCAAS